MNQVARFVLLKQDVDDLQEYTGRRQVTLIWLGLSVSLLGLALLFVFGLFGSGDSFLNVWGYWLGLVLMFAGLSLSLFIDMAL